MTSTNLSTLDTHAITHLLIDLDGTLLGNHRLRLSLGFIKRTLKYFHHRGGYLKIVKALLALGKEVKRPSINLKNDQRLIQRFSDSMKLDINDGEALLKKSLELIFPKLDTHFYALPEAQEFLRWAQGRYTLVLATNPVWPREIIDLRVRWAGFDPAIFSFVTDAHQMSACKPSAKYFQQILRHCDVAASQCLFIGNEIKMDLPATKVGIQVFIVAKKRALSRIKQRHTVTPAFKGRFEHLREMLSH